MDIGKDLLEELNNQIEKHNNTTHGLVMIYARNEILSLQSELTKVKEGRDSLKEWRCNECKEPCYIKTDSNYINPIECPFGLAGFKAKWESNK